MLTGYRVDPADLVCGPVGFAVQEAAAGLAVSMGFLKLSRDAEAEEKHKMSFIATAYSTYPMTGDSVERAQQIKVSLAFIFNQRSLLKNKSDCPILKRPSQP